MEMPDEYSLEFLPSATNDMIEIISSFVMFESKKGAIRIKNKMTKAAEQIHIFPYSGVTVHDNKLAKLGFRMIVIEKYLMFYKIFEEDKKIVIYRVLNGKTNYPALMYKLYSKD